MIVLCKAHHDRVHEGSLWILGSRRKGFRFTIADGTPYGSGAPSGKAVTNVEAFQILRRLGHKEKDIRPVLEILIARDLPLEELLTEALRMLRPTWDAKTTKPAASKSVHSEATPAEEKSSTSAPDPDIAADTSSSVSPTWDCPPARPYRMRPPENGGVAERNIPYRIARSRNAPRSTVRRPSTSRTHARVRPAAVSLWMKLLAG